MAAMIRWPRGWSYSCAFLAPLVALAQAPEEPSPLPFRERAAVHLVQLDVTLTGPANAVRAVRPEDFVLEVGGRTIERFSVDRLCGPPPEGAPSPGERTPSPPESPPEPRLGPTTYVFYFDQPHLTQAGRAFAVEMARELIPRFVRDGNRGMLVSNGARFETVGPLTENPQSLLDALARMARDLDHWDPFAQGEDARLREILDALREDHHHALNLAHLYYQEELWRTERDLRRFSMFLGTLADLAPPKVVVYFADTLRVNAGEHYLKLFGEAARRQIVASGEESLAATPRPLGAITLLDSVVDEASAHGVRLYTVEAQGLAPALSGEVPTTARVRDAQDTLSGLALETGGRAFLNGVKAERIASAIEEDLRCLYLISFDPAGLPEDQPLPVKLTVRNPKVRAQVRGRVVVQSASRRLTSRLLAAFASPEERTSDVPLHVVVVPAGFDEGRYTALVQVWVPGTAQAAATWDLGISVVAFEHVTDRSVRLSVSRPGIPVVLQGTFTFRAGPYEIVAVAHETRSDLVSSARVEGVWPKPGAQPVHLGPFAALQPSRAAFHDGERTKDQGPLAYPPEEPLRPDRPTALRELVCRGADAPARLRVERELVGASRAPFPGLELELRDEPCALVQDLIPAGTMTPGAFRYHVRVLDGERTLGETEHQFLVVAPQAARATRE